MYVHTSKLPRDQSTGLDIGKRVPGNRLVGSRRTYSPESPSMHCASGSCYADESVMFISLMFSTIHVRHRIVCPDPSCNSMNDSSSCNPSARYVLTVCHWGFLLGGKLLEVLESTETMSSLTIHLSVFGGLAWSRGGFFCSGESYPRI